MEMDKLLQGQKYFIFKIGDLVNNSFHTLEEKRMECLSQYLDLCISTYEEYRLALDPSKLKRSYEGLIEGLAYQLENHPFAKLYYYRKDFAHLRKLILLAEEERGKELHNIHRYIVSLRKKVAASDIINDYILCLKEEKSFGEIDILMETLISDLLYKGYSLTYLCEWFKYQQNECMKNGQDVSVIDNLKELNREPLGYTVYIKFEIKNDSQLNQALHLLEKQFTISNSDKCWFSSEWGDKSFYVASKEYKALDVTKAIQIASKEFNAVKELFDMWQRTKGCIAVDGRYGWIENETFKLERVNSQNVNKMLSYVDSAYKKQMERFLSIKYDSKNEDSKALERIMYTLNTAKAYKDQNRFLNFWSALEYTLYPFPRFTIIEKARVVVPEVFGLFYIKNKMNIFWSRMKNYLNKRMENEEFIEIAQFYEDCKEERDAGFDTQKVISVLEDSTRVERITNNFSKHIVLYREWIELQMLILKPEKAFKAIEKYNNGIMHDLNYIYRLRNQLIHSTKGTDDSLEYISMRLYRYVNSVLSTILYYKEKNSDFTITDILSSIDATYEDYIEPWKEIKSNKKKNNEKELKLPEPYKMIRPSYIFME